jgi:hypothetical protein
MQLRIGQGAQVAAQLRQRNRRYSPLYFPDALARDSHR